MAPLAERLRPKTLGEFIGQQHLIGPGTVLRQAIEDDQVPSLILWGPPGTGKTTLARIISGMTKSHFQSLSAVSSGVADLRRVIAEAARLQKAIGAATILFIDEIHRFNKSQQDGLLHSVEEGVVTLIGATTENPSFEVISPLLSRCRVYTLEMLTAEDLQLLIDRAFSQDEALKVTGLTCPDDARKRLMLLSGGDARSLLNALEVAVQIAAKNQGKGDGRGRPSSITPALIESIFQRRTPGYDKLGDAHYDTISAFIKSIRGSDPDAALHYLARMLESGEDPKFIARRMVIAASEDVGNADPNALVVATTAFQAIDVVGMPEARIILAQGVSYLAAAPKSNAAYLAIGRATEDVRTGKSEPVPLHLRNAPTKLMEELGYGDQYKYAHDFPGHFVDQDYLPERLRGRIYYHPTDIGQEKTIKDRLKKLWPRRYSKD